MYGIVIMMDHTKQFIYDKLRLERVFHERLSFRDLVAQEAKATTVSITHDSFKFDYSGTTNKLRSVMRFFSPRHWYHEMKMWSIVRDEQGWRLQRTDSWVEFLRSSWTAARNAPQNLIEEALWKVETLKWRGGQATKHISEHVLSIYNPVKNSFFQILSEVSKVASEFLQKILNAAESLKTDILIPTYEHVCRCYRIYITVFIFTTVILLLLRFLNSEPYKTLVDPPNMAPEHRPTIRPLVPTVYFPGGALSPDPLYYEPSVREEAMELLDEIDETSLSYANIAFKICKECKCIYARCSCPGNQFRAQEVDDRRNHLMKIYRYEKKLTTLSKPRPHRAFAVGDLVTLVAESNAFSAKFSEWNCPFRVTYRIARGLTVADTRVSTETHIRVGNCRFWVVRLHAVTLGPYSHQFNVPLSWYPLLSLPNRDLVVSEDLLRATRRGSLTDKYDKAVSGLLENILSVPLNDPAFVELGANPVKDTYFMNRALADMKCPVYRDF